MDVKEYLSNIRCYELKIKQMEERLLYLRHKATELRAMIYDKIDVQTSMTGSQMEEDVIAFLELKAEYKRLIAEAESERLTAIKLINSLNDSIRVEILYRRYIKGESWHKIAKGMHSKERNLYYEHSKALEELRGRVWTEKNKL